MSLAARRSGSRSLDIGTSDRIEVERLRAELADRFDDVPPDLIERDIRSEFERRAGYPVQDFVPVFVERSLRQKFRHRSEEA